MEVGTVFIENAVLLAEAERLLAEGLSVKLTPTGRSMLPFIVGGRDEVTLKKPSADNPLRKGQIALARLDGGKYVLHRILSLERSGEGKPELAGEPEGEPAGELAGGLPGEPVGDLAGELAGGLSGEPLYDVVLMGDGNLRQREHCRAENIIGTVCGLTRNGRPIDLHSRRERFKVALWRLLLPLRRYLLFLYRQF